MKKRINKNKWWLIATAMIGLAAPIALVPVLTSCSSSEKSSEPNWVELNKNFFTMDDIKPEYIQQYGNGKMLVIPENVYTTALIRINDSTIDYSYIVIPKNLYQIEITIHNNSHIKNIFWGEIGNIDASNFSTSMNKTIEYDVKNCDNFDWFSLPTYAEEQINFICLENTPKLRNVTIDLSYVSGPLSIGGWAYDTNGNIRPNEKIKKIILPDNKNSKLKVIREQAFDWTYFNDFEFPASLEEIESSAFYYPNSNPRPYFIFNSSTAIKKILTNESGLKYVFSKPSPSSDKYLALDLRKCTDLTYEEKEKLKVQYKDIFHSLYLPDWSSN